MIISLHRICHTNKNNKFGKKRIGMAETAAAMIFGTTIGVFIFLAAILFGSRARRYSGGYTSAVESHGG
jgi:uncharacterized protein YqgC (DUF456 family)